MKNPLLFILTCLVLCGCGPTTVNSLVKQKGAQQLPASDVLALVKGNTLFIRSFNDEAHLYFEPSGRLFAQTAATDKDKGKWDVSETGELCFRMEKWWYGDLRCFQVYGGAETDKVHLASGSGVLQYTGEQQAGDGKRLYAGSDHRKKSLRRSIRTRQGEGDSDSPAGERATQRPSITEERPKSAADSKDTEATIEWMAKDCPGCNLAGADLGKAELIGAKLAKADLHGANLSMANLRRADLQGANLRDAILTYTNLPGADLRGADLRGAKLKGANLIRADLTGARLEGADLTEILREGVKGLK